MQHLPGALSQMVKGGKEVYVREEVRGVVANGTDRGTAGFTQGARRTSNPLTSESCRCPSRLHKAWRKVIGTGAAVRVKPKRREIIIKAECYSCCMIELSHSSGHCDSSSASHLLWGSGLQPGNGTQLCLIVTDTDAGFPWSHTKGIEGLEPKLELCI